MSDLPPPGMTPGTPSGFSSLPPRDAAEQVKLPATFLLVVGVIGAVVQLGIMALNVLGVGLSAVGGRGGGGAAGMMQGGIGILFGVISLIVAGIIIFGAMKMKKLQSYNLAMAATILAMIPCISPCCLCGLPVGIWALIVLMKPEVKAGFHNHPGFPAV